MCCSKCRKSRESKNPKVVSEKKWRLMLLSQRAVSDNKIFIKRQKGSGLLNSLGIKTPLIKIPLLGPLLS